MNSDSQNPFAAAAQPASNGAPASNPFQASAGQQVSSQRAEASPFAGVDSDSPFGLADSNAGRPARLPERRFPEAVANGVNGNDGLASDASPFERAVSANASLQGVSPFEAVVGGPTEGFLAESPEDSVPPPPVQYQQTAQAVAPFEAVPEQDGASPFMASEPVPVAEEVFESATAPQNESNGFASGAFAAAASVAAPVSTERNGFSAPQPLETPIALRDVAAPPAAMRVAEPAVAPVPVQAPPASRQQPAQGSVAHGGTPQLVLRAIFGVNHELSSDEMLQRARTLPGVRNLRIVGSEEAQAMRVLRGSVSRLGFGDEHSISLRSADGDVDIIEEEGTTLAILHEDGGYAAGVRETLIIVTRELARLIS